MWNIRDVRGEHAHTSCVAFGIDRLVVALFAVHGLDTGPVAGRRPGRHWHSDPLPLSNTAEGTVLVAPPPGSVALLCYDLHVAMVGRHVHDHEGVRVTADSMAHVQGELLLLGQAGPDVDAGDNDVQRPAA